MVWRPEKRPGLRLGLGQRLASLVGLSITLVVAVVVTVAVVHDFRDVRQAFYGNALQMTSLVAGQLGGAVRYAKPENIEPVLDGLGTGQEGDLAAVTVLDAGGAVLLSRGLLREPDPAAAAAALGAVTATGGPVRLGTATAAPVRFGPGEPIVGALVVDWSDAQARASARSAALMLAGTGLGLAIAFSLGTYVLLNRVVASPVRRLGATLTELAEGRYDQPAAYQRRGDEIGAMARNLEALRAALEAAQVERGKLAGVEAAAAAEREAMLRSLGSGVGSVVEAARSGDFSRRVDHSFDHATLQGLADGVNAICAAVSRFLDDCETAMSALADGDLSHALEPGYQGRFGVVARAVNETLHKLAGLVDEVRQAQGSIAGTVAEIGRDSAALSDRAVVQATALQETSATMTELSTTIRANAENASASAARVGNAKDQADISRTLIGQAVDAMREIQRSTQEITEIVNAIDGFAFQTNLLALNAAVEAARAGEAGKGFAVVASEVRTLAQRAADAAKDIRRLISVSQSNVGNGAQIVDATGAALSDILTSFVAIAPAMADISNATREQSLGVGELTATLAQLDEATQVNAHLAEKGAQQAHKLRAQAEALDGLIAFFRREPPAPYAVRAAE